MSSVPRDPAGGSGPDLPEPGWNSAAGRPDPDDPFLLERLGLTVPDDTRALDDTDGHLLHPRRARWARSVRSPDRDLPFVAVATTLVLLVGTLALASALLGALTPTVQTPGAGASPLATSPVGAVGAAGGLLPDAGVRREDAIGAGSRELRPAVLVLAPAAPCVTCADAVSALGRQAAEYGVEVHLVSTADAVTGARALIADAGPASVQLLVDPSGTLTAAYRGASLRAVLVHADGVVGGILDDPSATGRFEQVLSPLRRPGAPPSLRQGAVTQ